MYRISILLFIAINIFTLINVQGQTSAWQWVKTAGGTQWENTGGGRAVASDHDGNIYVAGSFNSPSMVFASTVYNNNSLFSGSDIFLVKYDSLGNVLWAKTAGGAWSDGATAVAVDSNNDVYLVGSFNSTSIAFDSESVYNPSSFCVHGFSRVDRPRNILYKMGNET